MLAPEVAQLILESDCTVAFTGAGISTESGIPDFRSPGGIWAKYQPVYFQDFVASESARHEYWRQKCEAHQEFASAAPNRGHEVLARWEAMGHLQGVVTQNIDGLHQLAGSQHVVELHGTARQAVCLSCGERSPIQGHVDHFVSTATLPHCSCGGVLKHATISFGQALDSDTWAQAESLMARAQVVLALGSSLVVHPAASLPELAARQGANLVIINRDSTPLDDLAFQLFHGPLGDTLGSIDQHLSGV